MSNAWQSKPSPIYGPEATARSGGPLLVTLRFDGGTPRPGARLAVEGDRRVPGLSQSASQDLHGSGVGVVVALLLFFAIAPCVISWFPMDPPGAPRTSTGQTHGLIAIVTFLSIAVAAFRLGQVLQRGGRWHSLAPVSLDLGWAMAICIVLFFFARLNADLRRYFGAVERVLYLAIIGWLAVFALAGALQVT